MSTKSFKELIVWQKSRDLCVEIYHVTEQFPKSELFGLTSQMRRAAISICSNIAEGYNRFNAGEKRQFSNIAYGSGSELENQIELSKILFSKINYQEAESLVLEVLRLLNSHLNSK